MKSYEQQLEEQNEHLRQKLCNAEYLIESFRDICDVREMRIQSLESKLKHFVENDKYLMPIKNNIKINYSVGQPYPSMEQTYSTIMQEAF